MCVIIFKPAGKPMPDMSILDACATCNPHGYGFVSHKRHYKTMDYEDFLTELSKVKDNENCLIHMRIATHGSVGTKNCHPFIKGSVAFMHNGTLSIPVSNDMTDSETAFTKYIYPAIRKHGFLSTEVSNVIRNIRETSRFALMQNGIVRMFGDFKQIGDYWFSNTHWMYYMDRRII